MSLLSNQSLYRIGKEITTAELNDIECSFPEHFVNNNSRYYCNSNRVTSCK